MRASTTLISLVALATSALAAIPLGGLCTATDSCLNDAQCYGVAANAPRHCGGNGAMCDDNSQCAVYSCSSGYCTGPMLSNVTMTNSTGSAMPTGTMGVNGTAATASPTTAVYDGAAGKTGVAGGAAVMAAAVAFFL